MDAIGYVRVSTDKQADEGASLDVQCDKVATYCDLHDLELVEIYKDAGATAKNMDRDGLQSALAALDAGDADCIIVYKLDRLTRSTRDLCDLLDRFKGDDTPALKSVAESLDTSTAAGRMVVKMLGVVSEWECETIGERTSQAMQAKVDRGEYTGGKEPFGYMVDEGDGDAPAVLVENPEEQQILDEIHQLREEGLSLRKVAAELNRRGVARRNGNDWHHVAVSRVLKDAA